MQCYCRHCSCSCLVGEVFSGEARRDVQAPTIASAGIAKEKVFAQRVACGHTISISTQVCVVKDPRSRQAVRPWLRFCSSGWAHVHGTLTSLHVTSSLVVSKQAVTLLNHGLTPPVVQDALYRSTLLSSRSKCQTPLASAGSAAHRLRAG